MPFLAAYKVCLTPSLNQTIVWTTILATCTHFLPLHDMNGITICTRHSSNHCTYTSIKTTSQDQPGPAGSAATEGWSQARLVNASMRMTTVLITALAQVVRPQAHNQDQLLVSGKTSDYHRPGRLSTAFHWFPRGHTVRPPVLSGSYERHKYT